MKHLYCKADIKGRLEQLNVSNNRTLYYGKDDFIINFYKSWNTLYVYFNFQSLETK